MFPMFSLLCLQRSGRPLGRGNRRIPRAERGRSLHCWDRSAPSSSSARTVRCGPDTQAHLKIGFLGKESEIRCLRNIVYIYVHMYL